MAADESTSDCELVIDETYVEISSDEEFAATSIFHPMAITSADLQAELFHEDESFTCTVCNESFRYNVALICHMEMEHVATKINHPISGVKSRKHVTNSKGVKRKYSKKTTPKQTEIRNVSEQIEPQDLSKTSTVASTSFCDCCKKKSGPKHSGAAKFSCKFCRLRFCWESKYKKHLHKTHKLNAVVVCKLCSSVFADMMQLAGHSEICPNREQDAVHSPDENSEPLSKKLETDDAVKEVSIAT